MSKKRKTCTQLKTTLVISLAASLLLLTYNTPATPAQSIYRVCFTPGGNCTAEIEKTIYQAKKSILVQAYRLTSFPISHSLIEAKKRGIKVKIILDKSQFDKQYEAVALLIKHGIPIWIDSKPTIAHNKVMVIDTKEVITGSFNFTKAAQKSNAENLLIITDPTLARLYVKNWKRRVRESTRVISLQEAKQVFCETKPKHLRYFSPVIMR